MSYFGKQVGKQIGGMAPISAMADASRTAMQGRHFSGTAMKGSLEGLIKKKNALIEFNGVGYSNPKVMTKRYSNVSLKNNIRQYDTINMGLKSQNSVSNFTFKRR